jgi:GNAT superfamily N-acetyltransferase
VEEGTPELVILDVNPDQVDDIVAMIQTAFDRFIAPGFKNEGNEYFRRFIRPADLQERFALGSVMLTARWGGQLAGMIEVRDGTHIALLFTDERFQQRGVARSLLRAAVARCREHRPELDKITVNAAPSAVTVYERLGFVAIDGPQEKYGVRFVPMEKRLND